DLAGVVALGAAGFADVQRDLAGEPFLARVQVDVVRHQEPARADADGAGPSRVVVPLVRPEVGPPLVGAELLRERLVLALAHGGEVPPLLAGGGRLVEVDREPELRADALPDATGERHAIV